MAQDVVINGTTYPAVETVVLTDANGNIIPFYPDAVRYAEQNLSEAQKAQARQNLGVGSVDEVAAEVLARLQTPIFGSVDENCNINLTGALADGKTYTFTYEDEEGNIATIGTYTKAAGPAYTNQIPISTDTDGSVFNGKGYKANTRLNSSGVATNDGQASGWSATGFIPIVDGNTIRSSDGMFDKTDASGYQRVVFYKADKSIISEMKLTPTTLGSSTYAKYFSISDSGALLFNFNVSGIWGSSAFNGTAAYCRIVAKYIDDNSIVTINEEIV